MLRDAPVGYTCLSIDNAIDIADNMLRSMKDFNPEEDDIKDYLGDWIYDMRQLCEGHNSYLENLRDDNSSLRDWGHDMRDYAEQLEGEKAELEYKHEEAVENYEYKINELNKQISKLLD